MLNYTKSNETCEYSSEAPLRGFTGPEKHIWGRSVPPLKFFRGCEPVITGLGLRLVLEIGFILFPQFKYGNINLLVNSLSLLLA